MAINMTPATYFETIPSDNAETVVQHVATRPRFPKWNRWVRPQQFCELVETGGALKHATCNLFDGLSTQIPGPDNPENLIDNNRFTYLFVHDDFRRLARSMVHAHLLSLVLTPRETRLLQKTRLFFTNCIDSVIDLKFCNFHDADNDVIGFVLRHTGANLKSFHTDITCRAMLEAVHKYCTSLTSLALMRIGADTRGYLCLSSVGDWGTLSKTVRKLSLNYCKPSTKADGDLIRTAFTNLTDLGVTFAIPKPPNFYDRVLKFYGGVDQNTLQYANLGHMPGNQITELRAMYPNTRFAVRLRASDMLVQLAAGSEALWSVTDFRRRPGFVGLKEDALLRSATRKCTRLEEICVSYPLRVPMTNVRKLVIPSECVDYMRFVASNTGALTHLVLKGPRVPREVLELIAQRNPRLQRIHFSMTPHMDEVSVTDAMLSFLSCQQLHSLTFANYSNVPVYPPFSITPLITSALSKYRMRQTHVRLGRIVASKR